MPTRDIHMNQVNFDKQWLKILDDYVAPIQEKVFIGYYQRVNFFLFLKFNNNHLKLQFFLIFIF